MIIDKKNEFGTALDFAHEPSTVLVGDVIDLGTSGRSLGHGQPLYLVVQITTAGDVGATNTGATAFQLASDSVAAIAVDGTQTIHYTSDAFLGDTELPTGTLLVVPLPMNVPYERYVGLQVVQSVEGEDAAVGNAFLTLDPTGYTMYPDAVN
jgi:hypothetical protein